MSLPRTAFLLAFFLALSSYADKVIVNGTAAKVGKTVLTIQDALVYRALQRLKDGEKYSVAYEVGDELKKTVQKVVFEEMAYLEMKELGFNEVPRGAAEKIVKERKKTNPEDWREILRRFSLSENTATDRIHRIMQVEKFLQRKVDTLTPVVTDAEIEKYFKQNEARFRGSSLEQLKPSISLLLKKQYAQKGLEDWIKFLKEKYHVQSQLNG
jgi:hypothetical protein